MSLNLSIVSPAKVEYKGSVERVVVPGASGEFEILTNHAPIILRYRRDASSIMMHRVLMR